MATRRGPDNSVRVAIQGIQGLVPWANVFWCQLTVSSTPSQSDLDTFTTNFANAYKTNFAPRMNSTAQYSQAVATLFLPGGSVLQSVEAMTGGGTEAGTAISDQSACKVVSWLTGVYWRGGKPRTYLPAPVTADVTNNNTITATEQPLLTTAGNNFRTAINALTSGAITGTVLGFVSFFSGNTARPTPEFFSFTSAKVHRRLGSQRRRLGKWIV